MITFRETKNLKVTLQALCIAFAINIFAQRNSQIISTFQCDFPRTHNYMHYSSQTALE